MEEKPKKIKELLYKELKDIVLYRKNTLDNLWLL